MLTTATNLAKISVTPSQRSSMQISLEDSAQRDRNASMPAQKYTSSFRRLDSDETRDSSETSDGLQYTNASVPVAFRSPTPFERPDASPSITSSQSPRIFQPAEPLENASPASLVNNAGVLLANGAPLHASGTPPAQTFALPSAALQPQRGLELVEYLIISEDEIMDRLPQYEKRLVEAFVNGMSDGDQKAALQATLNERAWTWKTAFEAVNQIVNEATAAKKKRRKPKSSSAKKATLSPRRDANGRFASKRPKII